MSCVHTTKLPVPGRILGQT